MMLSLSRPLRTSLSKIFNTYSIRAKNEYLKNTCLYIEASSTYEGMNTGPGPKEAYGTSKVKVYQCQKPDLEDLEPIETACKSWHKDERPQEMCVNAMLDKVCKYGSATYWPPPALLGDNR